MGWEQWDGMGWDGDGIPTMGSLCSHSHHHNGAFMPFPAPRSPPVPSQSPHGVLGAPIPKTLLRVSCPPQPLPTLPPPPQNSQHGVSKSELWGRPPRHPNAHRGLLASSVPHTSRGDPGGFPPSLPHSSPTTHGMGTQIPPSGVGRCLHPRYKGRGGGGGGCRGRGAVGLAAPRGGGHSRSTLRLRGAEDSVPHVPLTRHS